MIYRAVSTLLCVLFLSPGPMVAALAPAAAPVSAASAEVGDLSRRAVEARLGRKLKFSERIALGVARRSAKRQSARGAEAEGGKLDVVSLIAGILGGLTIAAAAVGYLAALFALGALICGIIGLTRTRRDGFRSGKGFAIAGVVIGGLYFVLLVAVIAIIAAAFQ